MTEDQARALVTALRESVSGSDDEFLLERVWAEQSDDDWHVLIHFSQGAFRFEHRHRDLLDMFGEPQDPARMASEVLTYVLREPHGDGSYLPQPFPVASDGRYLREGWA